MKDSVVHQESVHQRVIPARGVVEIRLRGAEMNRAGLTIVDGPSSWMRPVVGIAYNMHYASYIPLVVDEYGEILQEGIYLEHVLPEHPLVAESIYRPDVDGPVSDRPIIRDIVST